MEEMSAYLQSQVEHEDEGEDPLPHEARGPLNEQQQADAFEAAFQRQHINELQESMANLKPSHRWLAMQTRLYRPALSPQYPSRPELEVAREIRTQLGEEGCEFESNDFNRRFQDKWLAACRAMSLGQRDEKHIGLIAPGSIDVFLKQYKKWSLGKGARAQIRQLDNCLRDRMRASTRDAPHAASEGASAPMRPGYPLDETTSAQSGVQFLQPPLAMHDHEQIQHAPFDPSQGHVPPPHQAREVPQPQATERRRVVCVVCGWEKYTADRKQQHTSSSDACMVPPNEYNPQLAEIRSSRNGRTAYQRYCKRHQLDPSTFLPARA